jgi:hypothetical protein
MSFDKKRAFVFFFSLIFLLTTASLAYAIGISPADAYVNFVPNHEYVIDYSISSYRPFEFYTQGSFSEFTRIETISQTDSRGHFRVFLTLPEDYDKPGKHRMYVAAKEKTTPGTVNTIAAIRGFIEIDVPYPGYYAEMEVNVKDVNHDEPIPITVIVYNKGKLNISNAQLRLNILSEDKAIKTIKSDTFSIETTGGYTFQTVIPARELRPGTYKLQAVLVYEGKPKEEIVEFRVGTFDVAIVNYTDTLYNNSVNLFEIEIESLWNNRIDTVYMDLSIMDGAKELSTAKTPPFDMLPWQKKKSSFYWNTVGIPVGEYDLKIVLHYGKDVKTEKRKIYIVPKVPVELERPIPVSTIILIVVAIIIIIFNVYFVITGRRKRDEEEGKK